MSAVESDSIGYTSTYDNSSHANVCMCFAGTQPGILKAAKRPGKTSFISSIDERLASSHALLYDVDRKVKERERESVRARLRDRACVLRPTQSTRKIRSRTWCQQSGRFSPGTTTLLQSYYQLSSLPLRRCTPFAHETCECTRAKKKNWSELHAQV